jgi:hypothetical protein
LYGHQLLIFYLDLALDLALDLNRNLDLNLNVDLDLDLNFDIAAAAAAAADVAPAAIYLMSGFAPFISSSVCATTVTRLPVPPSRDVDVEISQRVPPPSCRHRQRELSALAATCAKTRT